MHWRGLTPSQMSEQTTRRLEQEGCTCPNPACHFHAPPDIFWATYRKAMHGQALFPDAAAGGPTAAWEAERARLDRRNAYSRKSTRLRRLRLGLPALSRIKRTPDERRERKRLTGIAWRKRKKKEGQ